MVFLYVVLGIITIFCLWLLVLKIIGKYYIFTNLVNKIKYGILKKLKKHWYKKVYKKDIKPMLDHHEKYERWNNDINNNEQEKGFKKQRQLAFK